MAGRKLIRPGYSTDRVIAHQEITFRHMTALRPLEGVLDSHQPAQSLRGSLPEGTSDQRFAG
jgi:hypothetical protein